ncbi:MAG: TonB-dependent receptor [Epsilonproteobacteria bacterium]|nr:TonB-dependent receptor [Campylobacterota bacterium]
MKRSIVLSFVLSYSLLAGDISVEKIYIEGNLPTESREVASDEIKFTRQQDLAQILQELHPEINMVRASAIGNDIVMRGFKRDDINVLIDGAKIYGGCPNRMDPPAMHISISDIDRVEIVEGPFDVEEFGSMGGEVKVITKDPEGRFGGNIEAIVGSFGYKKFDVNLHDGDENFAMGIGVTHESSDQYEDGEGRTLVQQNWAALGKKDPYAYQERYEDLEAYNRNTVKGKVIYRPAQDHELKLSFMSDKATNVLYPAFQMDAQLDKTLFVNGLYTISNLGTYSKELQIQGYYSNVWHDMGTEFRNAALPTVMGGKMYRTHRVKARMKGLKIKNSFEGGGILWTVGIDGSIRNWNGACLNEPDKSPRQVRIPNVDTKNSGIFVKGVKQLGPWSLKAGIRFDHTEIEAKGLRHPTIANIAPIQKYYRGKEERDYDNVTANLVAKYAIDPQNSVFIALGEGVRVPDAQELYFIGFMMGNWSRRGNPDLKESRNREIDLGYEGDFGWISLRATLFYSKLEDYIYAYVTSAGNKDPKARTLTWTNIDAHIYGGDIGLNIPLGEYGLAEASIAYQRGEKDDLIPGQTDKDLAMIPPLRGRFALSYDDGDLFGMVELLASARYDNIDSDNGERVIDSWQVVNLKGSKQLTDNMRLSVGIDNLFDESYALNNTYVGRALVGSRTPVLINEPGRFIYANLNISF